MVTKVFFLFFLCVGLIYGQTVKKFMNPAKAASVFLEQADSLVKGKRGKMQGFSDQQTCKLAASYRELDWLVQYSLRHADYRISPDTVKGLRKDIREILYLNIWARIREKHSLLTVCQFVGGGDVFSSIVTVDLRTADMLENYMNFLHNDPRMDPFPNP